MTQNLESIKTHLREYCDAKLEPGRYGFYVCPLCNSGKGSKGTAAFSIEPNGLKWKCFSCTEGGDIFDLESKIEGVSLSEATKTLIAQYGSESPAEVFSFAPAAPAPAAALSFAGMLAECHSSLKGSAGETYLLRRGITAESMERFNLGFGLDGSNHPAIFMPHDKAGSYYTTRTINDSDVPHHRKPTGTQAILYNEAAMYVKAPCFVVESQLCAISIMQEGGAAVALSGLPGINLFLKKATEKQPSAVLILALDNDDPGQKAQEKLAAALDEKGIPYIEFNVAGDCKDPNELLQRDPAALRSRIDGALGAAWPLQKAKADKEEAELAMRTGPGMVDSFFTLAQTMEYRPIPTGISDIDRATCGGFTNKTLVLISGAPGLGKTAIAQFMTESIAKAGRDVLFINLEMSREQLLARSLSRYVWLNEKMDMSSLDVLRGYSWTNEQRQALIRSAELYKKEIAPRFVYNPDGVTNSLDSILQVMDSETVRIQELGREAPIICIDYLQLIDAGDKDPVEGLKKAIYKLKEFAKNHNTVVIAINATNRASNKTGTVDLESGRDTSATEYSGDLMLGLSYTALEDHRTYDTGKVNKQGTPVLEEYTLEELRRLRRTAYDLNQDPPPVCNEISLKVLKNRFGEPERRAKLYFDGRHNLYTLMAFTPVNVGDGWETIKGHL